MAAIYYITIAALVLPLACLIADFMAATYLHWF